MPKQYFHYIPGRLRISLHAINQNPGNAKIIHENLSAITGVYNIKLNPVTGRALIEFSPELINLDKLLFYISQIEQSLITQPAGYFTNNNPSYSKNNIIPFKTPITAKHSIMDKSWHEMKWEEVINLLESDMQNGLSSQESLRRLYMYGPNRLQTEKKRSLFSMISEQINLINGLLIGAGIASFSLGNIADGISILIIVVLETIISLIQEYRSEKSLALLKDFTCPEAIVIRDGKKQTIPATHLVPGDVIELEAGNIVPADCRLITDYGLELKEDILTGESIPVRKRSNVTCIGNTALAEQENMLFMGSLVTRGRARAIVVATGMATEMGKIAKLLEEVENELTPLQKQLNKMGHNLSFACIATSALITLIGILRGQSFFNMLRTGVSMAVGAIPEGLPAIITISMAFSVQRMVKKNAIVRQLNTLETLAYVSVICSDKTGTLTKNEMTVTDIYAGNKLYKITNTGFYPFGKFIHEDKDIKPENIPSLEKTLLASVLCNNAELYLDNATSSWQSHGNPTETALLAAAYKAGMHKNKINKQYKRIREIPFDSEKRLMAVIVENENKECWLFVKGAADEIIALCDKQLHDENGEIPLNIEDKKQITSALEAMTEKALRVIALASKQIDHDDIKQVMMNDTLDEQNLLKNLTFLGLAGMMDPPRPEVVTAVKKCQEAGIKVIMITGDHKNTAIAIAKQLNILTDGLVLSGMEIEELNEKELENNIDKIQVIYRASPSQKLKIVKHLKNKGFVVGMTGDGVNDAPAVKEADVGIAMGKCGTDVTREAAGITLTDDSFATIVNAIEEGRAIKNNIRKFIRYVLAGNLGELMVISSATVLKMPIPLEPGHILWINLVTEGIPALALGMDPPSPYIMKNPPSMPQENIFDENMKKNIFKRGSSIGLTSLALFKMSLLLYPYNISKAKTMVLANIVANQMFNVFDCRYEETADLVSIPGHNKYLLPSVLASSSLLLAVVYVPWLRFIFTTTPLNIFDWGIVLFSSGILGRISSLKNKKQIYTLLPQIEKDSKTVYTIPTLSENQDNFVENAAN